MKKKPCLTASIFRALKHRNFLLFFSGQGISLIGTWMQRIALSWLVYRLTNSALMLGLVSFANQIPTFVFAPIAGVFADRWDKHKALLITQILSMLQALILSYLVISSKVQIWQVLLLGSVLGTINAFDIPIRQSFVVEMVGTKEDLGNAIALNSSLVNSARLLGPSIAGIIISIIGEGMCFLLNGLSYIAVICSLAAMQITVKKNTLVKKNVWEEFCEGCHYAFHSIPIRTILLQLALVSLVGTPYTVLMPIFATDILHGGPNTLGFLMAAVGVGALSGAIFLAAKPKSANLEQWIAVASAIFGIGLVIFSFTTAFWFAIVILTLTGFGMMVQMAASNTMLQTIVDDSKRGRIMSFYTMAFMGMAPFGSLLAGSLANTIGTTNTILFGGISCMISAIVFAFKMRFPGLKPASR